MSSNRLPVLLAQVGDLHRDVQRHTQTAAEKALEAGAALVEAKSLCKHGQWRGQLKKAGIHERTAQRYMRLHLAGLKSAIVADLGVVKAERAATIIEKAWPDPGAGRWFSGLANGEAFWAITCRPDEQPYAFYACVVFHGVSDAAPVGVSSGHIQMAQKPMTPIGIAMCHMLETQVPISKSHDLTADEAVSTFETWSKTIVEGVRAEHGL